MTDESLHHVNIPRRAAPGMNAIIKGSTNVRIPDYEDFVRGVWGAIIRVSIVLQPRHMMKFITLAHLPVHRLIKLCLTCCKEHTNTRIRDID